MIRPEFMTARQWINAQSQTKAFLFTYFPPLSEMGEMSSEGATESFMDMLAKDNLDKLDVSYFVMGEETCPTSGKLHIQGYAQLANKKRIQTISKVMGCHTEIPRSTATVNINYCKGICEKKQPNKVVHEWGTPKIEKVSRDKVDRESQVREVLNYAKAGELDRVAEEFPLIYLQHHRTLRTIEAESLQPVSSLERLGVWIYSSETGTGKSRSVQANFPDAHWHLGDQWMDGYNGQKTIVYDDVDETNSKPLLRQLKRVCDIYPVRIGVKGSTVTLQHRTTIVTSNYTPYELWSTKDARAISRRFLFLTAIGWNDEQNDLMIRTMETPNGSSWLLKNYLHNYDLI